MERIIKSNFDAVPVCINKTIHVPHANFPLRQLLNLARESYAGGSRYYEVMLNGVFLARIAIPKDLLKPQQFLEDYI